MVNAHTDGKKYQLFDLAKAGSSDCRGCSACCHDMGDSIRLDPMDLFMLQRQSGLAFQQLLGKHIELTVVKGMILPYLKMDEKTLSCTFLSEERCSIHENRPGLCRLFPLGREYENGEMKYILLKDTCEREMTKVKISKWIGMPEISKYHRFVLDWHELTRKCQQVLESMQDEETAKSINLYLLHQFFQKPYNLSDDFYQQFYERYHITKGAFADSGDNI